MLRDADIHRQVAMNLEAAILLTRACLKGMLPQGSGSIVNISSVNALRGHTGVSVYSATKAALIGLTKSLAVEVGPGGIRVNCVAPGYFQSEMTTGFSEEQRDRIARRTPLAAARHGRGHRGGDPLLQFARGGVHHRTTYCGRRRIYMLDGKRDRPHLPERPGGRSAKWCLSPFSRREGPMR